MVRFPRSFRVFGIALVAVAVTSACSGGRGSAPSLLPGLPNVAGQSAKLRPGAVAAPSGDIVAINAGGAATGSFSADEDYVPAGTWTYKVPNGIDTSGVVNPAPQAVYQSEREGSTVSYSIPGLTPNATYNVRLSFAELYWTAKGQRVFNVSINNVKVLSNFDVFAATGARYKAFAQTFSATASSTGNIAIALSAITNYAAIDGIEVAATTSTPPPALVDWPTYAYDTQRSGFNPYTTGITPASIAQLHVGWQTAIHSATQTQPIVVTNVAGHTALLIVGAFAVAQAYDALTGKLVWQTTLPTQSVQDCGIAGVSGTAAYDKALSAIFVAAGTGSQHPTHTSVYKLDAATGKISGQVDITPTLLPGEANYSHSGVTLANGRIYLGTGSSCEGTHSGLPSWRGRVVSVDPAGMTLQNTFFLTWAHGGNFGGGGVWGWGGVSAGPSGDVYVSSGNAETNAATAPQTPSPPFQQTTDEQAGYAEHLVQLSSDLSTVEGSNYPGFNFSIGYGDLDYTGTPIVFQPPLQDNCGLLTATQGKGGTLVINSTQNVSSVLNSFALSVPSAGAYYIGNPAYSPNTGLLYAAITSAGKGSSLIPPGLAAISGCGSSIAWHAQFGPDSTLYAGVHPRSAPTVTAGGVVFLATPCTSDGHGGCGSPGTVNGALWAVDGTTGTILAGGKPVLITADDIRMAPSADGQWVWVLDGSGNMYGLTVSSQVKAITPQLGSRVPATFTIREP